MSLRILMHYWQVIFLCVNNWIKENKWEDHYFCFFIGLVLGEAAAIFLNRIGFFVMALFLLIFMIFCFIFYRKVRREQSLFFIYEVLCWFFFLMGGIAFFRASYLMRLTGTFLKKHWPALWLGRWNMSDRMLKGSTRLQWERILL